MKQNLYQILGVPQNASQSILNTAYAELLTKYKEHHNHGEQDAKNKLVMIKWAYDHLSNADKRAAYDVKLEAMPVKPRIVLPIPKVSSQPTTKNLHLNEEAQTDTPPLQSDEANQHHSNLQAVPNDDAHAAQWYRKAAGQGHANAQYELGALCAKGQGVPQDYKQAAQWYRKAADQGYANAQYGLGTLFGVGKGVPQDYEQAAQWIRKAADQGHTEAQGTLGALYTQGNGVPQDYGQAAQWFRKAANSDVHAQYCLGMLYANGQGVPKDLIEACKWLHIAGASGFSVAIENRELIESNLTIDEISEAKRHASSWLIESLKSTGAQVIEEVVNSSNADTVTSKSSTNRRTFCFANGETMTPQEYGINAIKFSLEGSESTIQEIIGSNESKIQQEISANRGPVQLHLMALQAAAFYVCANTLSSSDHDVLTDVAGGIANGFAAIMGEYHSDNLYDIFKDYGHSLAKELKRNDCDNFIDMGATAQLVGKNISGQCNIDTILADNPIEKLRIEEIVRRNGIGLLLTLLVHRGITYTA